MQSTIEQLTRTFISVAENVVLTKQMPLRALNGDLQALLLVGSTRRIRLTKELHRALLVVRGRVEQASVLLIEASGGKKLLIEPMKLWLKCASSSDPEGWVFESRPTFRT